MKLRVVTHSGEDVVVEVETFNATEFTEKLNNNEINAVELGGVVFSRIDIKLINPLVEQVI